MKVTVCGEEVVMSVDLAELVSDARRQEQSARGGESVVELYWLPLGAGGHSVRVNGKVFEAVAARRQRRERCDLYHAGLQVYVPEGRFVIEQAPAWGEGSRRGVVAGGPVGFRALGRFRLFRYEIRRWREGTIPDIAEAVDSPRRLSGDPLQARQLLDLVPQVPTPVWGRDELAAGEMWNSNSVIAWLLVRSGFDLDSIQPPPGGRAPGWEAGIAVARRNEAPNAQTEARPRSVGVALVENAVDITCSPEDVFDYGVDLSREPEWNPKAKHVEKVTAGPIGVGTRFEAEFLRGNPMTIEFVRFERPLAWDTVARSRRLDANGEGRVSATEVGAHLVMRMELRPKGALRVVLPVLSRFMHKQQERNLAAIKHALESSGATAARRAT
jgi:Polyketide cyclase / dehydrase and lipid transport